MTRSILTAAFLVCAAPALAAALEPINRNPAIVQPLIQGFIADRIADECPTISARSLKAKAQALALANHALQLGYTRAEIEAFVRNKDEKARGKAEALAYLTAKGAVVGQPETFCQVGRAEIAAGTLAGQLLRAK